MIRGSDQVKKILREQGGELDDFHGGSPDFLGPIESMRTDQSNIQSSEIQTFEDLIEQAIELIDRSLN